MKKKLFVSLVIIILLITGCSSKKQENKIDNTNEVGKTMKIFIDNNEYIINLENNETVQELISLLPKNLEMKELNGNEKYAYIDTALKANPKTPNHINAGDIMLYGNNCLVIFYKSFNTSYSYTKIGHINNLPDLGSENIKVEIKK